MNSVQATTNGVTYTIQFKVTAIGKEDATRELIKMVRAWLEENEPKPEERERP